MTCIQRAELIGIIANPQQIPQMLKSITIRYLYNATMSKVIDAMMTLPNRPIKINYIWMSGVRATATAKQLVSLSHIHLTRNWPHNLVRWRDFEKITHFQICVAVATLHICAAYSLRFMFWFVFYVFFFFCSLFIPASLQLTAHICIAHLSRNASAWDYGDMSV